MPHWLSLLLLLVYCFCLKLALGFEVQSQTPALEPERVRARSIGSGLKKGANKLWGSHVQEEQVQGGFREAFSWIFSSLCQLLV